MGNWIDISEQYIKTKTPEECEEHYFTFYYKSKQDSLPTEKDCIITGSRLIHNGNIKIPIDESKALESEKRRKAFQVKKDKDTQQEEEELAQRQLAHQNFMNNQSAQEKVDVHGQINSQSNQNANNIRQIKSRQNISAIQACTEVVGYLPKRGDFDQEYDMDAELLLADMEFFEEDTPENI